VRTPSFNLTASWCGRRQIRYHRAVSSFRRLLAGVILAVCFCAPVLELFDQWDRTLQDGNDTEINLIIVSLCVGLTFAATKALVAIVRASASGPGRSAPTVRSTRHSVLAFAAPSPNSRPPTPLRV
jgi:hypothetical protein